MVKGALRSRTFRRIFKRTPGSKTVLRYEKRKTSIPKCTSCGHNLKGTPRARVTEIKHMPKTKKRPERPFGGVMCNFCSRRTHMERARS